MESLVEYLKKSLRATNTNELCIQTDNIFDKNRIDSLVLDGIYISGPPDTDLPQDVEFVKIGDQYIYKKTNKTGLEWLNEDGTFNWTDSDLPMYRRLLPPPDESVNHTLIIKSVLQEYSQLTNYIEYGIRWGENFREIHKLVPGVCYGVDINVLTQHHSLASDRIKLYEMPTDTFGETVLSSINFNAAFIDADHSSTAVLKDFKYIFDQIDVGGYVFLHDTYPCAESFLDPGGCNDCYKVPGTIKEKYNGKLELLTLPLNPGLTIIRKI
jgi:hypothetical protein